MNRITIMTSGPMKTTKLVSAASAPQSAADGMPIRWRAMPTATPSARLMTVMESR